MKYISTSESAETWGLSRRRVALVKKTVLKVSSGSVRHGSYRKRQRSLQMLESKAENISRNTRNKAMSENQNIEWKSKWRDDYLEWICGFANAQGGRIYIGCDDNGHIIGLDNTKKLLEDIPNKVRNAMSIVVDVNRLEERPTEAGRQNSPYSDCPEHLL